MSHIAALSRSAPRRHRTVVRRIILAPPPSRALPRDLLDAMNHKLSRCDATRDHFAFRFHRVLRRMFNLLRVRAVIVQEMHRFVSDALDRHAPLDHDALSAALSALRDRHRYPTDDQLRLLEGQAESYRTVACGLGRNALPASPPLHLHTDFFLQFVAAFVRHR